MTDLLAMSKELQSRLEWQKLPYELDEDDIEEMICSMLVAAVRSMFVATGRYAVFSDAMIVRMGDHITGLNYDLPADEYEYVLTAAKIEFQRKVQTMVNNIVGYTTDALSVTHADKPYQYLANSIAEAQADLRKIFYTMVRHTML